MTPHQYLEHGLTVLEARLKSPSRPSDPGAAVRPFITISRETGAGASTLGQRLLPLLDRRFGSPDQQWMLLDKNLLTHALTFRHLPEGLAEFLPEDRMPEFKGVIGELLGLHPPLWQLEEGVSEAIRQLAQSGRVIFVGRAAHLITAGYPGGFHLRLIASPEARVRRMMALLHCDATAAAAHIRQNDHARRRFVRTYFDADIDDAHRYDMVINTDRIDAVAAAPLVADALGGLLAGGTVASGPAVTGEPACLAGQAASDPV